MADPQEQLQTVGEELRKLEQGITINSHAVVLSPDWFLRASGQHPGTPKARKPTTGEQSRAESIVSYLRGMSKGIEGGAELRS